MTAQDETVDMNESKDSLFRIGYVTDVEGNLDYFLKFVEASQVIDVNLDRIKGQIQSLTLSLKGEESYFVYGGDAVDKGPGDIRLVRALVDLKQRFPERVFLLVGNRDLNKLRLTAELSRQDMERRVDEIPGPHWDRKAPNLKKYLEGLLEKAPTETTLDDLNTRVNRLHYILEHTLGCPRTFEFRREELAMLQDRDFHDVSDHEVVNNFLYEVEEGSLFQYLSCANVAVTIGNTLFCHGAVDRKTMKFVPRNDTKFENPTRQPPPAKIAETVDAWVDALNSFLKAGLEDYQNRPLWNAERNSRGGESLMALQNRPAMWGRSIVSNCYGDGGCITTPHATDHRTNPRRVQLEDSDPLVFEKVCSDPKDPVVGEWLLKHGVQRVIVGHKPTGDCPAVLSSQYTGVEIVSADTSFSDTGAADNRGSATTIVEVVGRSSRDNQLSLRGTLRNGEQYHSMFHRLHSSGSVDATRGDPWLGREIFENWWIKVYVDTSDFYWLTRGNGRSVEYKRMDRSEIKQHFEHTKEKQ